MSWLDSRDGMLYVSLVFIIFSRLERNLKTNLLILHYISRVDFKLCFRSMLVAELSKEFSVASLKVYEAGVLCGATVEATEVLKLQKI